MPCSFRDIKGCTITFRLFFTTILIIGISSFCHLSPRARAAEPYLPGVPSPGNEADWEKAGPKVSRPNAFQIEFFDKLKAFDQAYFQWQTKKTVNAWKWENLANKVFDEYENMPLEGENGSFILRGKLIKGECLLFAAADQMKANQKKKSLENYRKGLLLLQRVILQEEVFRTVYNKALGKLPEYRHQLVPVSAGNKKMVHPYAGYEGIGTGLVESLSTDLSFGKAITRELKSVACGENYGTAESLGNHFQSMWDKLQRSRNSRLKNDQDIENYYVNYVNGIAHPPLFQKTTEKTARYLLSDFCPWGIEMFFFMEKAGLITELDFRILRPFSGYNPALSEKFVAGLKQFPDAIMGKPVASGDKLPPVISELVLKPPKIPKHIYDEMHLIIGDGKQGFLDTLKKRPIKWEWVGEKSTYTLWYLSPAVFDWQSSDYLSVWLNAIGICTGGPLGFIAGETLNGFKDLIGSYYGKEGNIYYTAEHLIAQYDMGILYPGLYEKQEWLSHTDMIKKLGGSAFAALEDQMRKDLYGKKEFDPKKFSLGKTYDGGPIPPVIIRSEVMGFEVVPDNEYIHTTQAVRFYLLYPKSIAYKGVYREYDLSTQFSGGMSGLYREKEYLAEQNRFQKDGNVHETVRKLAWENLPDPLSSYEIITDFTPKKQYFVFHLTQETSQAISDKDNIHAELWPTGPGKIERYTRVTLKHGKQQYRMALYNKDNPETKTQFELLMKPSIGMAYEGYANIDEVEKTQKANAQQREAVKKREASFALVDIKNQYELRLISNGKYVSAPYKVILDRGRKKQRRITGKITSPEPGMVQLDYSPEIEIVKLKVNPGQLTPGKPAGATIPDQSRQRNE